MRTIILSVMVVFTVACTKNEQMKTDEVPATQPTVAGLNEACAGFGNTPCGDGLECYLTPEQEKMDDASGVCVSARATVGEQCGTIANVRCDDTSFCKLENPSAFDGSGTCEARPASCPDIAVEGGVCGRDGNSYATECHANMVGVIIQPGVDC